MGNLSSAIEGLANGLNGYLGIQQKVQGEMAMNQQKSDLELGNAEKLAQFKNGLEDRIDPDTADAIGQTFSPELGKAFRQMSDSHYKAQGQYPTWDNGMKVMTNLVKTMQQAKDANTWQTVGNDIDGNPIQQNKLGQYRTGDTSTIGGKTILPKNSLKPNN